MRIEQFKNKNQFIIFGEGKVIFQSYDSVICIVDENGKIKFGRHWNYSHTTLKHLYLFLQAHYLRLWLEIANSSNKKAAIQKMIDNGELAYDADLV